MQINNLYRTLLPFQGLPMPFQGLHLSLLDLSISLQDIQKLHALKWTSIPFQGLSVPFWLVHALLGLMYISMGYTHSLPGLFHTLQQLCPGCISYANITQPKLWSDFSCTQADRASTGRTFIGRASSGRTFIGRASTGMTLTG